MLAGLHQERPCRLAGLCGQSLAHKTTAGFNAPVGYPAYLYADAWQSTLPFCLLAGMLT